MLPYDTHISSNGYKILLYTNFSFFFKSLKYVNYEKLSTSGSKVYKKITYNNIDVRTV